jgi:phosphatidylserine/phosphatidylglycerophosphate/cardiolipin synthase-like enzyme
MKLIVQPDAGIPPIITAIKQAKKTIDVLIFRLDLPELARELEAAVARGVRVRALTAHQNRGGSKSLRRLELQLLEEGVTVSRTADDLVRYHGKMMIIDSKSLHVYGFNFTSLDIRKSRSFGVVTKNAQLVREAMKLFEADFERQPYVAGCNRFVVSPENSRDRLSAFIKGARKQLLIYDPQVSDDAMLRLLMEREKAGVEVKIIGRVKSNAIRAEKFPGRRMHVRAIVRDGRRAWVGSQSLKRLELEKRREVGIVITDESVVREIQAVFERDWAQTDSGKKEAKRAEKAEKAEKKDDKETVATGP